jgi:hypothetical protein
VSYAFVGGTKFDQDVVREYLSGIPVGSSVYCTEGNKNSLQWFIEEEAPKHGLLLIQPVKTKDYTSKKVETSLEFVTPSVFICRWKAEKDYNLFPNEAVWKVCMQAFDGTLVIVGTGGQASFARSWIKSMTETAMYGNPRSSFRTKIPVEVVELCTSH